MRRSSYELLLLGISLALATGMWLYSQWVMLPAERAHYAAMGQPTDVGDLYPRWYGTRELLLHHRDPYSLEVSREIQVAYYGRALDTEGADRGRDEQRFAYPVYVAFLLAPVAELPFPEARLVARWVLATMAAASLLLWLWALRWRPSVTVTLALIALTLSSPPMVQALRLQQLAVLVAFFLAGAAVLVTRGKLLWAGCLLACATIKPQLALLPLLFFLIWVIGDWKRRRALIRGFAGTLGCLILGGQLMLPGWFAEFLRGLIAYRHYVVMSSLVDLYLTPLIAKPVATVVVGALLFFCFCWRKGSADRPDFIYRFALVLAVTTMALPLLPPFNQVLLLPGLLAVISRWNILWERGRGARAGSWLLAAITLSSWLVASVLALTHAASPGVGLNGIWEWPFILSFGVPPIVAGLLMVLLSHFAAQARAPGPTRSEAA
jgi:hypothetical protein